MKKTKFPLVKNDDIYVSEKIFYGKVVVITGGARGIGKNIARKFGQHGAHVIICDYNAETGKKTTEEFVKIGIHADFILTDLSREGNPQHMVQQVVNNWGKIDVLVNNARSGTRVALFEETESTWEAGLAVTLRAAFFASQEAIRLMAKSGGGVIVNISSVASNLACNESPSYHIAKAGLSQMTRYLAMHAGKFLIRINDVTPGFIVQDENMGRYAEESNQEYRRVAEFCHPGGQIGTSDNVADAVLFLCSPQAEFISGQSIVIDGGLTIQEPSCMLLNYEMNTLKKNK